MAEFHKKFENDDNKYFEYIDNLLDESPSIKDIIYQFPVFVGSVNLARFITLYEVYMKTINISGDILDVGTWKGFSFFTFAKLIKIFEPYSATQVHCIDWFDGMKKSEKDLVKLTGSSNKYDECSEEMINNLLNLQGLEGVGRVNNLNIITDLEGWCRERPWHRFKLIFLDCGIEEVLESSFKNLWDRLVPGGILLLDHFNSSASPSESNFVSKYCKNCEVKQISFSRSPSGYIIKK